MKHNFLISAFLSTTLFVACKKEVVPDHAKQFSGWNMIFQKVLTYKASVNTANAYKVMQIQYTGENLVKVVMYANNTNEAPKESRDFRVSFVETGKYALDNINVTDGYYYKAYITTSDNSIQIFNQNTAGTNNAISVIYTKL